MRHIQNSDPEKAKLAQLNKLVIHQLITPTTSGTT